MNRLLSVRSQIYDHFHGSATCDSYFIADAGSRDRYAAYYTAMYLLQDTAESLQAHHSAGFSPSALRAYIEFWGVMQALFIQQDAIRELYRAIHGAPQS